MPAESTSRLQGGMVALGAPGMNMIKPHLTSNDASYADANARCHWPEAGAAIFAVVLLLILVACRHQGSEIKPISAATPQESTHHDSATSQPSAGATVGQDPADERQRCALSNAVCSATPVPAGAEAMDSAASQPSSVVTVRTEFDVLSQRTDSSDRVRPHQATPAAASTAAANLEVPSMANASSKAGPDGDVSAKPSGASAIADKVLPQPQPQSTSLPMRASSSRDVAAPLIVTAGATTQASYWYAWLTLLVLLLLVWWWSRRRSQTRVPSAPRAVSSTAAAAVSQAATVDVEGNGPIATDEVEQPQAAAAATGSLVIPSVPLQNLTFAPVGAIDDATDREIALPKQSNAVAGRGLLQPVPVSARQPEAVLVEAKRLLASARPEDALRELESLLGQAQPPQEAWVVAGWAWWRLAHDNDGALAYAQADCAAEAFTQALQGEPGRTDLMTRIARSHLLRAQHAPSDAACLESVDTALEYLSQRSQARADEPTDHLEWAHAALQRANAGEREGIAERQHWLTRAQQHLDAIPATHALLQDVATKVLSIDIQLGLAASTQGEASARLYRRAIEQLRAALVDADAASTDAWLAKIIDSTRALIKHQSGGSRLLTLQSLKVEVAPYLQRTHAVAPLLAWINLLDEWARLLPARSAQAKLAEADQLFERASRMNSQGPSGIQFARAYYLRARSQHEQGTDRQRTLHQARGILDRLPGDALPASIMKMERAEIALALARHADDESAPERYGQAVVLANQAALAGGRPIMAWHCAAQALLGLSAHTTLTSEQHTQLLGLAKHLEEAGADHPSTLRTAAQIRLQAGEFANSSRLCEAAWNAGASRVEVLPLWQEADARWARTLEHANEDAGWRRLHQRLRLASTSY